MQVSHAIYLLQKYYKPEDHLVIAWWDKEWVDALVVDEPLTEEEWAEIASDSDESLDGLGDQIQHHFTNLISDMKASNNNG